MVRRRRGVLSALQTANMGVLQMVAFRGCAGPHKLTGQSLSPQRSCRRTGGRVPLGKLLVRTLMKEGCGRVPGTGFRRAQKRVNNLQGSLRFGSSSASCCPALLAERTKPRLCHDGFSRSRGSHCIHRSAPAKLQSENCFLLTVNFTPPPRRLLRAHSLPWQQVLPRSSVTCPLQWASNGTRPWLDIF